MAANGGATAASRSRNPFGPAMRACASEAPPEAAMVTPLHFAPSSGDGHEELLVDRSIETGRNGAAVVDERGGDGPIRQAGKIGAGAVDRVDDPDMRACEPRRIVGAFLR